MCSVVIENYFISDFMVVVNSVSIVADIILIHLSLIFMVYSFPIHLMIQVGLDLYQIYMD